MEDIIKIDIPKGYEFAGVNDDEQQVVFTKILSRYPKTYEECIGQLPINWDGEVKGYKCELLLAFQKLLIARDVYRKIAGEQMGLGKPWEPDWADTETDKYVIEIVKNTITIHDYPWNETNHLLAFPTEEMRDIFYENFKSLIEECKELL